MTRSARNRDERGAVFVFSVMILAALMLVASFVVDLGIDRIVRTDMQSLADTTALDMSTILDGSQTTSQILASSAYATTKAATLARNANSTAVTVKPADVEITFGMADANGAWLGAAGPNEYPNAVKASASGSSSIRLWPGEDPARPRRSAIAARQPKAACITVGSYLAGIDTAAGGNPLAKFLNEVAPTSATIFSGDGLVALKGFSVPLADLVAELHVADPANPLDADVKISDLAHAAATVLNNKSGSAASSAVLELNRLAAASAAAGITESVKLGEIVQLGVGNSAAVLSGDINVFDLVTSPVFAFDGAHVINLPATGITVPGFVISSLKATVINPPKTVCGGAGTEITNSQITLEANVTLSVPKYKKCGFLDLLCGLGNLLSTLGSLLGGDWKADGTTVLGFKLVLNGVNAAAKIDTITSCEPTPDVNVSATTSATTGTLTLTALSGALQTQVNVPQALASSATHNFTQSPSSWTHIGGLGSDLIGPVNLDAAIHNSNNTSAIILNLAASGVNLGGQLTTALNGALSGLGLSLNGANVSLAKMGTCNDFGLRK
jgi:hypothetical protein